MDWYQLLTDMLVGRTLSRRPRSREEWSELVALAHGEGVGPLLDQALRRFSETEAPASVQTELASASLVAASANLVHESIRARICRRLAERALPVLLLKGAALAFQYYDDPATRPMGDLDLLVPPARLAEAAECLEEEGFTLQRLPRSLIPRMNRPKVHHVYLHPRTQAVVELHWELPALRKAGGEALTEIWSHARPADRGVPARVMGVEHLVPLLCAHMTLQHKRASLLWLHDLHRVLLAAEADEVSRVPDVARRWRLAPCTAFTLLHVQELFGSPLSPSLASWAQEVATRNSLQARVTALALVPGSREWPDGGLVNLLMNGDWGRLRSLLPAPEALRTRAGLAPEDGIAGAYAALLGRYLRQVPVQLPRMWRFWRAAPHRPRPRTDATLTGPHDTSPAE